VSILAAVQMGNGPAILLDCAGADVGVVLRVLYLFAYVDEPGEFTPV